MEDGVPPRAHRCWRRPSIPAFAGDVADQTAQIEDDVIHGLVPAGPYARAVPVRSAASGLAFVQPADETGEHSGDLFEVGLEFVMPTALDQALPSRHVK